MKTFVELKDRLSILASALDGDLWRNMMQTIKPPSELPEEQAALDMVYRDAKAFGGYIPDVMVIMRRNLPAEISAEEILALTCILGYVQLVTRLLLLILLIPRYHDHEDLVTTFNGFRQSLVFIEDYLEQAVKK